MRPRALHKVGVTTALTGSAALAALDFGSVAATRITTGTPVAITDALSWWQIAVLVGLWLAALALSLAPATVRLLAAGRGLAAGAFIVGVVWFSGAAAERVLAPEGPLARYSLGPGVWVSAFAAFALLIASRREVGEGSLVSLALVALVPLGLVVTILSGRLSRLGVAVEYRNVSDDFWIWTGQHVAYAGVAMAIAIVVGFGLGVAAFRTQRFAESIFTVTSVFQTIPGLAMIGILAVPLSMAVETAPALRRLGIGVLGWSPVVIALTLYALLAIVRNTYAGLQSVSPAIVEAGRGMGLAEGQILRKVQLPLSAPIVFSGVRTAAQQTIGNATLGVFVAAGTLGRPIFGGVSQTADDLVLLGSIALVVLALSVDVVLRGIQRGISPRHTGGSTR